MRRTRCRHSQARVRAAIASISILSSGGGLRTALGFTARLSAYYSAVGHSLLIW
jgi:hypothetical protein